MFLLYSSAQKSSLFLITNMATCKIHYFRVSISSWCVLSIGSWRMNKCWMSESGLKLLFRRLLYHCMALIILLYPHGYKSCPQRHISTFLPLSLASPTFSGFLGSTFQGPPICQHSQAQLWTHLFPKHHSLPKPCLSYSFAALEDATGNCYLLINMPCLSKWDPHNLSASLKLELQLLALI